MNLADQAVAAQAYYRQSQDVDNEMDASRIRMCARSGRLGEIPQEDGGEHRSSREATTSLADLGIPKDRASRAMQLAEVPSGTIRCGNQ